MSQIAVTLVPRSFGSMNAGQPTQRESGPGGAGKLEREIGKPGESRGHVVAHSKFQFATAFHDQRIAVTLGLACGLPICIQFFQPRATGRIEFFRKGIAQLKFRIFQESCKFAPQRERILAGLARALEGNATDCAASILLRISSSRGLALS